MNLEPVVAANNVAALAKNAPHPNAAMLFLDFMLKKKARSRFCETLTVSPRILGSPIPPACAEGFNFIVIDTREV